MKFVNCAVPVKRKRNPNGSKPGTSGSSDKHKRTRNGCLCCRQRKKKCDETHPQCRGCTRNLLTCVWPEKKEIKKSPFYNNTSFLIDATIDFNDVNEGFSPQKNEKIVELQDHEFPIMSAELAQATMCSLESPPSPSPSAEELNSFIMACSAVPGKQYCQTGALPRPDTTLSLSEFSTWIPGLTLSKQSAFLYHIYVHDFMRCVTPQICHPSLTPQAIFVPPAAESWILREVFELCAAAFLSWKFPQYKIVAQEKYVACASYIRTEILSGRIEGVEDWLLVALQSLCLLEKFMGENSSKSARHLTASFKVIQKRYQLKNDRSKRIKHSDTSSVAFLNSVHECLSEDDIPLDSEFFERNNETIVTATSREPGTGKISASEKTLMESFVYNYSVTLLLCKSSQLNQLPSPFAIFSQFKDVIYDPVFDCAVPWMNNSIFGASIKSHEIAAKASWLSRMALPLKDGWVEVAEMLYSDARDYVPPELPESSMHQLSYSDYQSLKYSIYIAICVAAASTILLRKVLIADIREDDLVIQNCVKKIYDSLNKVPSDNFTNAIISWSTVVAGCCALDSKHRELFEERCYSVAKLLHARYYLSLLPFLYEAWGYDYVDGFLGVNGSIYSTMEGYQRSRGVGCDILLDRNSLERINV